MLKHQQIATGTELANLYLSHLQEHLIPCSKDTLQSILAIFSSYPRDLSPSKTFFMKKAVSWAESDECYDEGVLPLYDAFAKEYEEHQQFGPADKYYTKGTNTEGHLRALIKWIQLAPKSEHDLFLTRTVLRYLVMKKPVEAKKMKQWYQRRVREATRCLGQGTMSNKHQMDLQNKGVKSLSYNFRKE
eukprot:TRINITY_DN4969_c0_g1_i3.p1 TRINITY_DN4969_c0_g1~~TRINITY_DN4969_c0_g1_i3.p1  ORF type:complete len:188 (-),score=36.01 TRINITY_DN4969_c0_g1_i3:178-741(-)